VREQVVIATILAPDTLTILTGVAATLCLTAAPMFRSRRMILLAQLGAGICFAAHYVCLGIAVAAAANMLGTVQTGAALLAGRSAVMSWLGYVLIGLMVLLGLYFWQGPISALSVAATSLIALGRMQSNEVRLRVLLLAGGGFWIMHDFLGEAWIALTADIGAATMGAAVLFSLLFRVTIERRASLPAPAALAS
jgi:hypothetical protein